MALLAWLLALSGCGGVQEQPAGTSTETAADPAQSGAALRTAADDPEEQGAASKPAAGYITFVINVHDTVHVNESAETILRLIGIYEKYGVRGDFYLTAPITALYSQQRPDVIERLQK